MQTHFAPEQLKDARIQEADAILRRCVHCGLCTAVCPTYVLLGDERDSPRGRIYLIKDVLEGGRGASKELKTHVDRCLSCLSCMTTCPSGVDYMHLVDIARVHIAETGRRSFKERFVRRLLAETLPYPDRFRLALKLAPLGRPWLKLMRRAGLKELAAMIELAPRRAAARAQVRGPRHGGDRGGAARARDPARRLRPAGAAPRHQRFRRSGCWRATASTSSSPAGAGCCGALTYHLGNEEAAIAIRQAQRRCLVEGDRARAVRRHHRQRVGLRHHGQGLRPPAQGRARVRRARRPPVGAGAGHLRVRRRLRPGCAQALVVAARRLPPRLLAAARPARRRAAARAADQGRLRRRRAFPRRTSAAARPAPTTFCSPSSRPSCATARPRTSSA